MPANRQCGVPGSARSRPAEAVGFHQLRDLEPVDLSNKAPRLRIHWDARRLGITGAELVARLDGGTRAFWSKAAPASDPEAMDSTVTIMPYMMDPGEERMVADALSIAALANPGPYQNPVLRRRRACRGRRSRWAVTIKYLRGQGEQQIVPHPGPATSSPAATKAKSIRARCKGRCVGRPDRICQPHGGAGQRHHLDLQGQVKGDRMAARSRWGNMATPAWTAIRA